MNPAVIVGISSFVCSLGGVFLGMRLRTLLPERQVSEGSKNVIGVAVAVVSTLAALVAGLLLSSAKGSFETKYDELRKVAAQIIVLDHKMAEYGPEAGAVRPQLRSIVMQAMRTIWGETGNSSVNPDAIRSAQGAVPLQRLLLELQPKTDAQRWLKSSAIEVNDEIENTRWLIFQQKNGDLQWPFVAILVIWFGVIFLSFGLYAPRNATVLLTLVICALSVSSALYLIVQLDSPYRGLIQIPNTPLQLALEQIGK
jgi:hypothetical protein